MNYLSTPLEYTPSKSSVNLPLVQKIMSMQQGTYDVAKQNIQQTLDAFGVQAVLRPQDAEYIQAKLSGVTAKINSFENKNLAQSNVTDSIMGTIKSAARDPFILSAIENTRKYKTYEQEVATTKEKKPELYNDANYKYGLAKGGFQNYIDGKSDKIGNLTYTPYTDTAKTLKDYSENLDKYADVVKENTPDGLYFVNKEGKRLTQGDIENQISTLLSDKEKQQMQINGWSHYQDGIPAEATINAFKDYSKTKLDTIDGQLAEVQTKIANSTNETEKNNLNSYLTQLTKNREDLQNEHNDRIAKKDFGNMSYEMEYNNTIGRFAKVFAFDNVGTTYSVNSAAVDQLKLQYKELTALSKTKTDANGDGISDINSVPIDYQGETTNFLNTTKEKADSFEGAYSASLQQEVNKLPQYAKDSLNNIFKNHPTWSKESITFDYMKRLSQGSSNLVSKGIMAKIEDTKLQAEGNKKKYVDGINKATEQVETEVLPSLIDGYLSNPDIKVIAHDGKAYSGEAYLRANKIKTVDDLNTPTGKIVKEQLLKSYYADQILSDSSAIDEIMNSNIAERVTGVKFDSAKEKVAILNSGLRQKFKTDQEYNNFLNNAKKQGVYDTNKSIDYLTNFIGLVGGNLLNRDNSVEDDRGLRGLITTDKINERAAKLIGENAIESSDRGFEVQNGTPLHSDLMSAVSSEFRTEAGTAFKATKDADLTIRVISPDIVEVSQIKTPTKESPSNKITATVRTARLPQSILQSIDFASVDTVDNIPETSSEVRYFSKNDIKTIRDVGTSILGSQEEAFNLTKEFSVKRLLLTYENATGSYEKPTQMGQIIKQVVEGDASKPPLQVAIVKEDGDAYLTVKYKKGNQENTIFTFTSPIPKDKLSAVYKEVNYTPQKYTNAILEMMAKQQVEQPKAMNEIYNNLLEVYAK